MTAAEVTPTKFIVNALELVLVVSAAFLLAHYVALFLDDKGSFKISAYQKPVSDIQQFPQSYDFKNMFFPELTVAEDTTVKVRAAESTLDIKLFGLRSDGNGMGSVIYKIGGQEQQNVRVGEQMADKIKLLAVYNDRIEINNNGSFETVSFGKVSSRLRGFLDTTSAPQQNETLVKTDETQPPFLTTSYFKPVKNENGAMVGFILQAEYAAMLSGTAFMPDDVIMEINGERVHNYENLSESLEKIRFGQQVDMMIERNGNKQSLTFTVPLSATATR